MNSDQAASSFDEIIKAGRQRRQYETLAQEMLGSGRKTPVSGSGSFSRGKAAAPSSAGLASRVGVTKRSSSATPRPHLDKRWSHDLHSPENPRRGTPRANSLTRTVSASTIERGLKQPTDAPSNGAASNQFTIRAPLSGPSMSIRGMASTGPYVVIASNFAPGTTAADIEAAMQPVGGPIDSCHLVTARPTVMAEIVFAERDGAENVIATFNNQKADGRLLYVYMKKGGPSPRLNTPPAPSPAPARTNNARDEPRRGYERDRDRDMMDVDDGPRPRGADPSYEDGRYGFRESDGRKPSPERRVPTGPAAGTGRGGRLYSDGMYRGGNGRYRR